MSDVGEGALVGVDLWMDHTINGAFFICDQLQGALKKANLFKRPRFVRCKLV